MSKSCSKICATVDELVNPSREASFSFSKMRLVGSTAEVIIRIKLEKALLKHWDLVSAP